MKSSLKTYPFNMAYPSICWLFCVSILFVTCLILSTYKRFWSRWHHNIVELALYKYNIITTIIITIITIIIFHLMHDLSDFYVWQISRIQLKAFVFRCEDLKAIHQRTPSAYSNTAAMCVSCVRMQGKHIRYPNGISFFTLPHQVAPFSWIATYGDQCRKHCF